MGNLDLRPLSVGEILDRTFTLYRGHFVLFLGISAIPRILLLALNLAQLGFVMPGTMANIGKRTPTVPLWMQSPRAMITFFSLALVTAIIALIAYLLSQGAAVFAVSEIYLGRTITMTESFRRVFSRIGMMFGLMILNGLAIFAGFIFLIIPGIYLICRLIVGLPAMLVEDLGPTESMSRSFTLTQDNAGRAFLILLLYFALSMAAAMLFAFPFEILMLTSLKNPQMMMVWAAIMQVGTFIGSVLVVPVLTISSAILYFDLRVRKEAFDLQVMMNPMGGPAQAPATGSLPTMFN
jgi:hypothetical protein